LFKFTIFAARSFIEAFPVLEFVLVAHQIGKKTYVEWWISKYGYLLEAVLFDKQVASSQL